MLRMARLDIIASLNAFLNSLKSVTLRSHHRSQVTLQIHSTCQTIHSIHVKLLSYTKRCRWL